MKEEKIRAYIENKSLQNIDIFTYDMTDSTNTRAREYYFKSGSRLPAVFIANGQTHGRGRRGRSFDSARGAGLYISFLIDGGNFNAGELTVMAAVKCARAIQKACGLSVGIKWVNDLFSSDKKLAGILAEGEYFSSGRQKYAVVGIGINLLKREFPEEIAGTATSIEAETGKVPDQYLLAGYLIDEILSEENFENILSEYRERSTVIGKEITAKPIAGGEFDCTVIGITDSGALLVEHADGRREELISAEVSIKKKTI